MQIGQDFLDKQYTIHVPEFVTEKIYIEFYLTYVSLS